MIGLTIAAMMMQGTATAPVTLGEIRMHLFYAETGRLSRDISPPNEFAGWNTIIGEGDAEENANDVLVVIELRSSGEQNFTTPLYVVARDRRGRVLGQRRFAGGLTGDNGRAYQALHLPDVGCVGPITVTATMGRLTRRETLALNCGE
jgi:hypothetical protein